MKEHQSPWPEAGSEAEADPVWLAFVDPPDAARPRAWWHWMDGNVDPEGIERDLRWLHDVGVRGVQVFDGGMGGPLLVPAAVRPGSEAWDEAVDTAVRTASELGMELAVATSSGVTMRPVAWRVSSARRSSAGSSNRCSIRSTNAVCTVPGLTALTRIPSRTWSVAMA